MKLNLSDLHPNLPKFILNELLRLKQIATYAEVMVKRHGWNSRRGRHWYNVGRKADRRYRKVWRLDPWPKELIKGDPVDPKKVFGPDDIPEIEIDIEVTRCPISGHVRRMRMRFSFDAIQEFKSFNGVDLSNPSVWELEQEVVE
jgi:hypothetical protein